MVEGLAETLTEYQTDPEIPMTHTEVRGIHLYHIVLSSFKYELPHGKTKNLHRRKQKRRSVPLFLLNG